MSSFNRASILRRMNAPPKVRSLAGLLEACRPTQGEQDTAKLLAAYRSLKVPEGKAHWPMLPELQRLIDLDAKLPSTLQLDALASPGRGAERAKEGPHAVHDVLPVAVRVVEACTPWMEVPVPFRVAVGLADDPEQWAFAAPQITIRGKPTKLPANGALARWLLSKRTDLLFPFGPGLATEETIAITVEGRGGDTPQGSRRYSHVLSSTTTGPGLLDLHEDTGWIELSGDDHGCLLCIQKRVIVSVPRKLDEEFGALLPTALSALLWTWGAGFIDAAQSRLPPPVKMDRRVIDRSIQPKAVTPERPPKKLQPRTDGELNVCVMGAGPAGLACAWLLSRQDPWPRRAGPALKVKVTVVEQNCQVGGKAASGRRVDQAGQFRIEEHGLHVLMGSYKNTLKLVDALGVTDRLDGISLTEIPASADGSLDRMFKVQLQSWEGRGNQKSAPFLPWMKETFAQDKAPDPAGLRGMADLASPVAAPPDLEGVAAMGNATPASRPLLRAFSSVWGHVANLSDSSKQGFADPQVDNAGLQLGLRRLSLAETGYAAHLEELRHHKTNGIQPLPAPPPDDERIGPLADVLRDRARSALVGSDTDVRLAREAIELVTTIAIGLDDPNLFPNWAMDGPGELLEPELYRNWVQAIQRLDTMSIAAWLTLHGAEPDFARKSRILAAVTSGLFTSPEVMAAGTFIHGLARSLFTYEKTPYLRMQGGTGEALIWPLYNALFKPNVKFKLGHQVTGVSIPDGSQRVAEAIWIQKNSVDEEGLLISRVVGGGNGWPAPLTCTQVNPPFDGREPADAFVLAIPPFGGPIQGLPSGLADDLAAIGHRATVGLQCWSTGAAKRPKLIVAGMDGLLRCAATMDHLQGCEGPTAPHAPVYYCGDYDDPPDGKASDTAARIDDWLKNRGYAAFQDGDLIPANWLKINDSGSERYVLADPKTQAKRRYAYDTGVSNLWLAGDWTRTAMNCGAIEAAVTSGLEAARDILESMDCKVDFTIIGDSFASRSAS